MDIKTLDAKVTALEGMFAEEAKKTEAMKAEIEELKGGKSALKAKKVEKKVPLKTPEQTFKVDSSTYKFKVPSFRLHVGPVLTTFKSEEALKNSELLKRLVEEKRFGIIGKVK